MQGNQVAKELLEALIHVTDVKMGCMQRLILIKGKLTQNCRRFKQRNVKLCLQFVNQGMFSSYKMRCLDRECWERKKGQHL